MVRSGVTWATVVLLVLSCGITATEAQKLPKKARKAFEEKYVGQKFRLRIDLRPVEPYVGTQFVDSEGPHFPNYKQPVMYEALETVAIDSTGNLGGNFFIVVATEPATSDRVVKAQVAEGFAGTQLQGDDAISRASRETLASVELRVGVSGSKLPADEQLAAVEELLNQVFYIDDEPEESELISFVKSHREYPIPVLVEITGLTAERVKELLEER